MLQQENGAKPDLTSRFPAMCAAERRLTQLPAVQIDVFVVLFTRPSPDTDPDHPQSFQQFWDILHLSQGDGVWLDSW